MNDIQNEPNLSAMTLQVNGQAHQVTLDPDTPLIYILRNDLGLKGLKYGCGLEQCGACKVIIDGQAKPTCRLPLRAVQGCEITTLAGLGPAEALHPVQIAFMAEQAIQCGYCVSGMIMTAKALLDRNPNPTEAEIRAELAVNLCRCGTHQRIIRAVQRAAQEMQVAK